MPRTRPAPAIFVLPAMALVAVLPLIVRGCSCGHDFDFHLLSWFEAAAQFRAGNLHPSWAFSPAFNAGEPRFVFYPPLSWTLGAVLGLILPWAAVPVVYTWMALTASGAAMYRLARSYANANVALLVTAVYVSNPYMLFTAYERTAYAELLAAAWLPLLLSAALRDRVSILRIATPVALLWLTNVPAAVMGCYALALIALVRLVQSWLAARRASPHAAFESCTALAIRFTAGIALGLGLAAFYIVPAAYERRWVQINMATISGMRIIDNFLFHHTADLLHDQVLHTASVIAVILLTAAVAAFLPAMITAHGNSRRILVPLAILSAAIAFMLTPISTGLWRLAPEMAFLQFPWRLLAILAPGACLAFVIALSSNHSTREVLSASSLRSILVRPWACSLISFALVAAITIPSISIFRQPCDDEDTVAARLALFDARTGTDPTDEYTPTAADNDSLAHADPSFWLAEDSDNKPPPSASPRPVPMHFTTTAAIDETLILNRRAYPAWQVRINGTLAEPDPLREDGLIAIPVHAGPLRVDIAYVTGRDHILGDGISFAAVATALALGLLKNRSAPPPRVSS